MREAEPEPADDAPRRGSRRPASSAAAASARSVLVSRVSITNTPLARSSSDVGAASSRRSRSTSSPRSDSARAISTYSMGPSSPTGHRSNPRVPGLPVPPEVGYLYPRATPVVDPQEEDQP